MQHTSQYMLLAFIAGNALWQGYTDPHARQ